MLNYFIYVCFLQKLQFRNSSLSFSYYIPSLFPRSFGYYKETKKKKNNDVVSETWWNTHTQILCMSVYIYMHMYIVWVFLIHVLRSFKIQTNKKPISIAILGDDSPSIFPWVPWRQNSFCKIAVVSNNNFFIRSHCVYIYIHT